MNSSQRLVNFQNMRERPRCSWPSMSWQGGSNYRKSFNSSIYFLQQISWKKISQLTAHSTLLSIIKNLLFTYLDRCEINCDFRLIIKFYLQEKRKSKFSRIDFRESRGKGIERKLVGKRKKKIIIENGGRLKIATFLFFNKIERKRQLLFHKSKKSVGLSLLTLSDCMEWKTEDGKSTSFFMNQKIFIKREYLLSGAGRQ